MHCCWLLSGAGQESWQYQCLLTLIVGARILKLVLMLKVWTGKHMNERESLYHTMLEVLCEFSSYHSITLVSLIPVSRNLVYPLRPVCSVCIIFCTSFIFFFSPASIIMYLESFASHTFSCQPFHVYLYHTTCQRLCFFQLCKSQTNMNFFVRIITYPSVISWASIFVYSYYAICWYSGVYWYRIIQFASGTLLLASCHRES